MAIGLALSGGGLRATLFHLGVVRALKDAGRLQEVAHICSVSGGSILAAHLVLHWDDYLGDGFESRAREILDFSSYDIRNRIVRRYPLMFARWLASKIVPFGLVAPVGATDLLQRAYRRLYGDATLDHLRGTAARPRPKLQILTTNLTTGTLCSFGGEGFLSEAAEATGRSPSPEVRIPAATPLISFAVAASSAFPGMFSPLRLTSEELGKYDAPLQPSEQFITDGGVYDNLGVRKFLNSPKELAGLDRVFVSNAGLELKTGGTREHVGMIRTALRASDLLSHRVHQLEVASMDRVTTDASSRKFVPIEIGRVVPRAEEPDALHENSQEWLRWIRTDLDEFSGFEQHCLVRHGWTLARRALRETGLGTIGAPPWEPVPAAAQPADPVRQVARLSRSVQRRMKFFGSNDPVSWVHAAFLLLMISLLVPGFMAYEHFQRPLQIRVHDGNVRSQASRLQHRLSVELSYRRTKEAPSFSRESGADGKATPSSYVSLAVINSLLRDEAQRSTKAVQAHLEVLHGAFAAADFDAQGNVWGGAWEEKVPRAEASFWAVGVLSRLKKPELQDKLDRALAGMKRFYPGDGLWLISTQEKDPTGHARVSALAIDALLDHRRSLNGAPSVHFDPDVLPATCRRLLKDWQPPAAPEEPGGWKTTDAFLHPRLSPALTYLVAATLLRADIDLLPALEADIARHMVRLRSADPEVFVERRRISLGGQKPVDLGQYYQGVVWAADLCNEWYRLLCRRGRAESKEALAAMEALDRLVARIGDVVEKSAGEGTEDLAELHLVLGRLLEPSPAPPPRR